MFSTRLLESEPLEKVAKSVKSLGFVWVEATPDLVLGEIKEVAKTNGVETSRTGGFWYGPRDADGNVGQKAAPGEKVIYHLHGGGYVMGSAHPSNTPMVTCFNKFLEHFNNTRVFAVEYRISSAPPFAAANPFPAALIDAIAGYRYLVADVGFTPADIIISGDSAGGNLAFVLARYLAVYAAELPGLSGPGALLLLSPTVDWAVTHTGADAAMARNTGTDFVHTIFSSGYTRAALLGRLPPETAATSVWISPGSLQMEVTPGMFKGLPKTCIVTGAVEMTLDPMRTLRDRMRADMSEEVTYVEVPDSTHDFFVASWHEPERTDTLREVAKWLASL